MPGGGSQEAGKPPRLILRREHLLKRRQYGIRSPAADPSQFIGEPTPIDRPDLSENDLSGLALEAARHAGWVRLALGGHRCDDCGADGTVHFVRRDYQTRPGFPDFAADGRIEVDDEYIESADHHSHRPSSHRDELGDTSSRRTSSPRLAISWNAAAQPPRGRRAGRTIRVSFSALISTSPSRPDCSSRGLGMRRPFELPMRTMRVFMGSILL